MGKSKHGKEKPFNRNVEISAPILDPEIIKAIHTPPKGHGLDIRHAGFKALLSDLNSQDSIDELTPLNENHVPSYIGISCAVSGYSSYSSYGRKPDSQLNSLSINDQTARTHGNNNNNVASGSKLRATSPAVGKLQQEPQVHHITIDRSHIQSPDEERKEITEKLTTCVSEHRRSPSPCIPPTESDRHHGTYVGARYCPMPVPGQLVNKHIPLLGIDDDQNDENQQPDVAANSKVEQKIANLYGDTFVEDWKESMTHKVKKEVQPDEELESAKSPKDLVTLKPTPAKPDTVGTEPIEANIPAPNAKVLASVEKQFLNKLLTDDKPPMPSQSQERVTSPVRGSLPITGHGTVTQSANSVTLSDSPAVTPTRDEVCLPPAQSSAKRGSDAIATSNQLITATTSPTGVAHEEPEPESETRHEIEHDVNDERDDPDEAELLVAKTITEPEQVTSNESASGQVSPNLISLDSGRNLSILDEDLTVSATAAASETTGKLLDLCPDNEEGHIDYLVESQSPVANESSPVRVTRQATEKTEGPDERVLVSFSPEPVVETESPGKQDDHKPAEIDAPSASSEAPGTAPNTNNATASQTMDEEKKGHHYLKLLESEEAFIRDQINQAESVLARADELELSEDVIGNIHSAIGKANLLLNNKCNQFRQLCNANLACDLDGRPATLNDDLAGFWDMLYIQVNDIRTAFNNQRALLEPQAPSTPSSAALNESRKLFDMNP